MVERQGMALPLASGAAGRFVVDDPGERAASGRRSRRAVRRGGRAAAAGQRGRGARGSPSRRSCSPPTAAAPTATPASPPTPRSAGRWTSSCATAAPGVLAETPEIYGAEHLLVRRAINEGVAQKLLDRYKWWEWYCRGLEAMDNNPAPGNKAGGITTVSRSRWAASPRAAPRPLMDVVPVRRADHAPAASCSWTRPATIRSPSPGSWPAAATSSASPPAAARCSAASRCPRSSSPPTAAMYRHMEEDMDIDCGVILDGTPLERWAAQIFEEIVAVASGKRARASCRESARRSSLPGSSGRSCSGRARRTPKASRANTNNEQRK